MSNFTVKFLLLIVGILAASILSACGHAPHRFQSDRSVSLPAGMIATIYQHHLNHLNGVRRGQCPMYPSCSHYSRQAFSEYGPIIGWVMTTDRLMRCGRDEMNVAPTVYIDGVPKKYDPLEHNAFWRTTEKP